MYEYRGLKRCILSQKMMIDDSAIRLRKRFRLIFVPKSNQTLLSQVKFLFLFFNKAIHNVIYNSNIYSGD